MKKAESTKKVLSRRAFMKSVATGGGALILLGTVVNSLTAQDLEVLSSPKRAKLNEPGAACKCGDAYNCSGGGMAPNAADSYKEPVGACQCGQAYNCSGSGT